MQIRLLTPSDGHVLDRIAADDADFDIEGRGEEKEELEPRAAIEFLSDPGVLCWAAFDDDEVVGFLHCQTIRKHAGKPLEMLLYEIGVRACARRKGVGRALMAAMGTHMKERSITEVWVLADNPGAVAFYAACGFDRHAADAAVYMTREL